MSHYTKQQNTPALRNDSKTGVILSTASSFNGYCCLHGWKSDLGVITSGSTFLISPTSCLSLAHSVVGISRNVGMATGSVSDRKVYDECESETSCTDLNLLLTAVNDFRYSLKCGENGLILSWLPITCFAHTWVNRPKSFHCSESFLDIETWGVELHTSKSFTWVDVRCTKVHTCWYQNKWVIVSFYSNPCANVFQKENRVPLKHVMYNVIQMTSWNEYVSDILTPWLPLSTQCSLSESYTYKRLSGLYFIVESTMSDTQTTLRPSGVKMRQIPSLHIKSHPIKLIGTLSTQFREQKCMFDCILVWIFTMKWQGKFFFYGDTCCTHSHRHRHRYNCHWVWEVTEIQTLLEQNVLLLNQPGMFPCNNQFMLWHFLKRFFIIFYIGAYRLSFLL